MKINDIHISISYPSDNEEYEETVQLIARDLKKNYSNIDIDLNNNEFNGRINVEREFNNLYTQLKELNIQYKEFGLFKKETTYNGLRLAIENWSKLIKKSITLRDILAILEKLINTLELSRDGNTDATKIFVRFAIVYITAYAIKIEDYSILEEILKHEYMIEDLDNRELAYNELNNYLNPTFIYNHVDYKGREYHAMYQEIEKEVFQTLNLTFANILEADVFLEFISNLKKDKFRDWIALDRIIYSEIDKNKKDFIFLRGFKNLSNIKKIFQLINIDTLNEFNKRMSDINNIKLFKVIDKEAIGSK
ncbi:hypothetical protein [Staphylococcus hominis]|uniref:hypothetical protein n=1 Tax=Staphylococcus hominis TaxID=1290 RepID=UPI001E299E4E|nr:hypothetical protein [Staphylococcus hominis]MCD8764988.1 hypothetical protein [Staphylococcus hominis]